MEMNPSTKNTGGYYVTVLLLLLFVNIHSVVKSEPADGVAHTPAVGNRGTKCYDDYGKPQRCIPEFENAAFNVLMEATNTCGENGDIEFCVQTGASYVQKTCDMCRYGEHSSQYLTDFNNQDNVTWWQSETMYEGVQYPSQINLTLNLRKAFDITYVRIWFYSPRPESFAIFKRADENAPWIPYQFYSATCRDMYGLPDSKHTIRGEETRALCTSEYSDISPLRDGNVAFSTLEGRPGAYSFDSNTELQEWVTATDVMISLDRLNTFGDEVFGDAQVLRSYFYAIADVAVGARCKCNGHASDCVKSTGPDGQQRRVCLCEHNTAGPDCNECKPFYNDEPWGRATAHNAHECKACNCNGYTDRCYFDKELYERTGHGGHCLDCSSNRDGPNCERCRENYYQRQDGICTPCGCSEVGSRSLQCNREGRCQCKPGVTGDRCDRCAPNHYDFGQYGCQPCGCSEAGSRNNTPHCDPYTGVCICKEHVEGKRCRECKPGFFNLDIDNEFGCTPCFCYGHSSECETASGYSRTSISSMFDRSIEKWSAQDEYKRSVAVSYNALTQNVGVKALGREAVYFSAPERFLGDQRASYNRDLTFTLRIGESGPSPTATDIYLEGAGTYVSNTIFSQGNQLPSIQDQKFKFRLHEHPNYGWQPRLSARAFMQILTNLTAIRIRGTYTPEGVGFLDNVQLETALRGFAGHPVNWIERCHCPEGYVGQFCESCAPGYRHSPALGGSFMPCIPCDCNKHADICDSETGKCICHHNTAGDNCEYCAKGYYGNALIGQQNDCKPCLCPNNGACIQLPDETLVCLECPTGYAGPRCDLCSDGYFGDPTGRYGSRQLCKLCDCNLNVDPNAIGNCNRTTGECLKCIHNTGGEHCDQCLPGFYGDALSIPKGDCKACQCDIYGTEESPDGTRLCNQLTGQCTCKSHVLGRNCDQCEDGYYNIASGEGCKSCQCDPIGSVNHTCNIYTGQCYCQPGITGLHCDKCETYKYGFSAEGCKSCDCDPIGSAGLQCDPFGQCPCLTNVEGRQCDRCKENKYDRQQGCVDCPACYNLVQTAAHAHQAKLDQLKKVLTDIANNPTVPDDKEFNSKLTIVHELVNNLYDDAKRGAGGDDLSLTEKLDGIRQRLSAADALLRTAENLSNEVIVYSELAQANVSDAQQIINAARQELNSALDYLDSEGNTSLNNARERSREFGQQSDQMQKIAHDARTTAAELEKDAQQAFDTAQLARNTSFKAYELARKALDQQLNNSDNILSTRGIIGATKEKLEKIEVLAENAARRAQDVHQEALETYQDVSDIVVPVVNIQSLETKAKLNIKEADDILENIENLSNQNQNMLNDINEQLSLADQLITEAEDQQRMIEERLSDADLAKAQAEFAVNKSSEILSEGRKTLEILREFDDMVQANKTLANKAIEQIPEIQKKIQDVRIQTYQAQTALHGAENNAISARNTAQDAKSKFAEEASKDAENIRIEAEATRQEAGKLRDEADNLAGRVEDTANKIKELEDSAVNDADLISEAKKKVGQADTDSAEALKQVQKALREVEGILAILGDLPNISSEDLDKLERKIIEAEEEFENANLDQREERMKEEKQRQNNMVEQYEAEVRRLTAEVENIKDITESLPDGCFKRTKLEP